MDWEAPPSAALGTGRYTLSRLLLGLGHLPIPAGCTHSCIHSFTPQGSPAQQVSTGWVTGDRRGTLTTDLLSGVSKLM